MRLYVPDAVCIIARPFPVPAASFVRKARGGRNRMADDNIVIYLIDGGCNASEETVQAR
jgi:hypothetical protein